MLRVEEAVPKAYQTLKCDITEDTKLNMKFTWSIFSGSVFPYCVGP